MGERRERKREGGKRRDVFFPNDSFFLSGLILMSFMHIIMK